MRFKRL